MDEIPSFLWAALYILAVVQISNLFTTLYLHRCLSHQSIRMTGFSCTVMEIWLWVHNGIHALEWVASHRLLHRAISQGENPSSVTVSGWRMLFRCGPRLQPGTTERLTRDIVGTRLLHGCCRRRILGLAIGTAPALLLLGPWALAAFPLQMILYNLLFQLRTRLLLSWGYRNFENPATNLPWLAWICSGEGLENNHLHRPDRPKFSVRRFEFDPAWPVIRLLRFFRLIDV